MKQNISIFKVKERKKNINPVRGRKPLTIEGEHYLWQAEKEHKPREGTETLSVCHLPVDLRQEKEHKPREGTVYTRSRKGDVYEFCLYH